MKKLFFAAIIAAALFACSDDSDSTTTTNNNNNNPENPENPQNPENPATLATLDGTWKLTGFTSAQPFDLNNDGTSSSSIISESGCYDNSKIVFGQSGHAVFSIQELEIDMGTINSSQDYDYTVSCGTATPEDYTYTYNDTTVTFTYNGGMGDTEAITFIRSGSTLTVTAPEMVGVPYPGTGGTVLYNFYGATITFTKVQ